MIYIYFCHFSETSREMGHRTLSIYYFENKDSKIDISSSQIIGTGYVK